MKYARICIATALVAAFCSLAGEASAQAAPSEIESADQLFKAGKFAEARELCARIVAQDPKDYSAILQLGRIALLANRLDDAEKSLQQAITLKPDDDDAKIMLAETFYRRDDFEKAATSLTVSMSPPTS